MRPTVDQMFNLLRNSNQFFSVEFERRTSKPGVPAGTLRKMLCRAAGTMLSYKNGVISTADRDAEDFRTACLTVWDMPSYLANRERGLSRQDAGRNAWRRIDLVTVLRCSMLPQSSFPPNIRAMWHEITNDFRTSHMPRIAI